MRLILFALLALFTLLLLRFLGAVGRARKRSDPRRVVDQRPAVSPDQVVDVRYEECEPTGEGKEGGR